jgi:hypothetical protein
MLAVFTPAAVAAAVPEAVLPPVGVLLADGVLLVGALLDELLDELQAASAARPAAAAGITSSARRGRLVTFSLSCEVIISFSPFLLDFPPFSLAAVRQPGQC